jgi:predicted dehydrogenase
LDDFETVKIVKPDKIVNAYAGVVLAHAESIISGKRNDGEEAIHNLRLCMAAYESADNGGKLVRGQ